MPLFEELGTRQVSHLSVGACSGDMNRLCTLPVGFHAATCQSGGHAEASEQVHRQQASFIRAVKLILSMASPSFLVREPASRDALRPLNPDNRQPPHTIFTSFLQRTQFHSCPFVRLLFYRSLSSPRLL